MLHTFFLFLQSQTIPVTLFLLPESQDFWTVFLESYSGAWSVRTILVVWSSTNTKSYDLSITCEVELKQQF